MRLVNHLIAWIAKEYLGGNAAGVLWDSASAQRGTVPPPICGYRPDAYVIAPRDGQLVLGEAKSPWDLENRHTIAQFLAFLTHCRTHGNAVLALAVPWHCVPLTSNMVQHLKQKHGLEAVEVAIIRDLPG